MCWKCLKPIENTLEIYRTSVCPECGTDLHCCRNCKFYSPNSHYDCHESIDELVVDKERANFCDWFSVAKEFTGGSNGLAQKNARTAFDNLFSV
ncbi:MAG: hypothetical protein J6B81_03125 [Spirochaetaceae bacterium]|nr:hypothetical protein [Spirochaetaceae bacterium]